TQAEAEARGIRSEGDLEQRGHYEGRQHPSARPACHCNIAVGAALYRGLFNLPLGHLGGFYMIPRRGYEKCKCGRTPSALDVVYFALTKHIHQRELIRDTLIGFANVFEMANEVRGFQCHDCARPLYSEGYWAAGGGGGGTSVPRGPVRYLYC